MGETGGGKSTILSLLFRFYDVQQGAILIDDQDIKDVSVESLRKYIGVVPQDPALFNATVMENVRYSKLGASDEEVMDACKSAAIHDKILTFTEGYQTKVGENGVKLSGGELQRIAIARVILKNPEIILLDEATSAVDTETEAQIQEALHNLTRGRTTITIAHRLSTVTNSDVIVVIKQGKIVEQGSPHTLLEAKGKFSELWLKQVDISLPTASDQTVNGEPADPGTATSKTDKENGKAHLSEASSSSGKSLRATAPEFVPSKASSSRNQQGNSAKSASSFHDNSAQEQRSSSDASIAKIGVDKDGTQQKRKAPTQILDNATASEVQRDTFSSRPETTRQTGSKKKRLNPAQRRRNNKSDPSGLAAKHDEQEGPSDAVTSDESAGLSRAGLQPRRVSAPVRPLTSITNGSTGGRPQRRRAQRWQNLKQQSSDLAPTSTSGDWSTDTLHPETPVVRLPGSGDAGEPVSLENRDTGTNTGGVHFAPGF